MSELVKTPVEMIPGNPSDHKGGPGVYNGIDGWEKRTGGDAGLPEKVIDKADGFASGGGKG